MVDLRTLEVLLEDPGSSAVLTDFDGTLAQIVPDPEVARPVPDAPAVLGLLSRHFAVVGVVSGRPARFLADALATSGSSVRLVGVYGFEWFENGRVHRAPEVEPWAQSATEVLLAARREAPEGVGVEDKGASVTLHWRRAPQHGDWAGEFARRWSERKGLVLQPGRMAVEIRPPVALDKGVVVERLAGTCSAVCFAGDDAGDLAAFDALDRLSERGSRTIRMAVSDEESPQELIRRADLVVSGPFEAVATLGALAGAAARQATGD